MYNISKEFHFSSSHSLCDLEEGHPCMRVHGHNYIVVVELESPELDESGMVLDYRKLDPIKKWIDETLDHRHLNDIVEFNPTAENLAKYIFEKCQVILYEQYQTLNTLSAVSVKETPKTIATYRR